MKLIKLFLLAVVLLQSACTSLSTLPAPGDFTVNIQEYGNQFEKLPEPTPEPKLQIAAKPKAKPLNTRSFTAAPANSSETIQGYDVLGLAMYCDRYLAAPKLPALSTVLATFGNPLPCVEKRIQKGGLSLAQIDPIDCTAQRNGKELPGAARCSDPKAMQKRTAMVQPLCQKYPGTRFQVTCGLEDDVKNASLKKQVCEAAQKGCPCCQVLNSPFTGARIPGYQLELHGTKRVTAYSVSGDGASIFDADNINSDNNGYSHNQSGSFSTYAWWNEVNLRCSGEKTFTTPLRRTNKPTLDQFWQAYLTMQAEPAKPNAPPICKSVRETEGGEIGKPNAESYCNGVPNDGRGNKPLLILKKGGKRGDKLKIFTSQGKEVGCFAYYGPYEKGLHRWYVGSCSGETPYQLYKELGGEWGYASLGGGQCLRFNAIRRTGTYR